MQGAASDRTLISSGLFFAPAKLNIHKTLPRMSYEPLTYARSIYIVCPIGYFASEYCPAGIYLLKVNNRNTGTTCEICLKLTIKIPE